MWNIIRKYQNDIILVIGVILISLFSFAMGYIMANQEKEPLKFEQSNDQQGSYNWSRDKWSLFS